MGRGSRLGLGGLGVRGPDLSALPAEAVLVVCSHETDARAAVAEIRAGIGESKPSFVLLFVPATFDRTALAAALREGMTSTEVFGCTTAGQITPEGYENNALLALAFRREHFRVASALVDSAAPVDIAQVVTQSRRLVDRFPSSYGHRRLALVFMDGQSKQEDVLVAALAQGLRDIPVFGGSAGDGLAYGETLVLHGGSFHKAATLLLLLETDLSFKGIGFDHFTPTDSRMVVTRAVPEERLVLELNGNTAAVEYARLVGVPVAELSPIVFSENPVLVRNGNNYHVRAIKRVRENGGLSFMSAIDNGLLLRLGRGKEILRTLDGGLTIQGDLGENPDIILGFDCVLRRLEIENKGLRSEASDNLRAHRVVGFNTYGEQHLGVHVNQTFVGVAFFGPGGGGPGQGTHCHRPSLD
ncbi:MAG: FIST C-terminal domain-containing protein [Rhodospirillum sp.]|nr:FIST C-terminal domain-containing protein [Rhodospirillum sp.]MCF8489667.1 FIST C-terminal domain-containing protein [Rhodospirillum sp.]MCF8501493.1 FIST C-terminal domain-containing protein [Rhodospirillum sp.]